MIDLHAERNLCAAIVQQAVSDLKITAPQSLRNRDTRDRWRRDFRDFVSSLHFLFESGRFVRLAGFLDLDVEAVRERAVRRLETLRESLPTVRPTPMQRTLRHRIEDTLRDYRGA